MNPIKLTHVIQIRARHKQRVTVFKKQWLRRHVPGGTDGYRMAQATECFQTGMKSFQNEIIPHSPCNAKHPKLKSMMNMLRTIYKKYCLLSVMNSMGELKYQSFVTLHRLKFT